MKCRQADLTNSPSIGNPSLKMSGSYLGASTSYTELGPPEIMIALKPWSLMYWADVANGRISDSIWSSRTFLSMTCKWVRNNYFRSSAARWCNSLFHIELLHPEWWLGRLLFYHFQRSVLCQVYSFSAPRCNTNGEKSGDKVLKASTGAFED